MPAEPSALYEGFQAIQRGVPLGGDAVQAMAGGVQRLGPEFPNALAAQTGAARKAGVGQHVRCLVTAWRVTDASRVRCAMDIGPPADRRATMRRRVSSPRAAKIGAALPGAGCR
jgi:hypothetical protein